MAERVTRPVGDFFGPYFALEFYYPLTLPASNAADAAIVHDNHVVNARLNSIQLRNYAAKLTVEAEGAAPLKFTLTLSPPYDAALEILDNRLIRIGTIVKVEWGYLTSGGSNDIKAGPYFFRICEPPKASFGKDITITIIGYDPVSSALMGKERKEIFKREDYRSDKDLIQEILRELKYVDEFRVDPTTDAELERAKDPEREPIEEQRDLWLLLQSVCGNNNLTFFISAGNKIVFHDLSALATIPEAYRLLWYVQPQNDKDIPMSSFSAEALPAFFASPSKSVLNIQYDIDKGQISAEQFDPSTLRDKIRVDPGSQFPGGTKDSTTGKSVNVGDGVTITPSPPYIPQVDYGAVLSQPNLIDNASGRARRLMLEALYAANNRATVVCPGHPDVFPPMNIIVEGVGKAFSGTYQIRKVKHEIGSGYDMTLDLMRLASPPELNDGDQVNAPVKPTAPTSSSSVTPRSADKTG